MTSLTSRPHLVARSRCQPKPAGGDRGAPDAHTVVDAWRRIAKGAIPSPNIWHTPQVYELENRAVDPDGAADAAMRAMRAWRGATVLDIGCGTGYHLPGFAADGGAGDRRGAARRPRRPRRAAAAPPCRTSGAHRHRAGPAAARRVRGRRRRPLGVLLRSRLRARPARAVPGGTARRRRVRHRPRRHPRRVRPVVPAARCPRYSARRGGGLLGTAGLAAAASSTCGWPSTAGPTWRRCCASSSRPRSPSEAIAETPGLELAYPNVLRWRLY